jgi:hypothetical protein
MSDQEAAATAVSDPFEDAAILRLAILTSVTTAIVDELEKHALVYPTSNWRLNDRQGVVSLRARINASQDAILTATLTREIAPDRLVEFPSELALAVSKHWTRDA